MLWTRMVSMRIAIFYQINKIKAFNCKFFPIFRHQNPGSGTGSGSALGSGYVLGSGSAIRKNAGSGSALNQYGFTTPEKGSHLWSINFLVF